MGAGVVVLEQGGNEGLDQKSYCTMPALDIVQLQFINSTSMDVHHVNNTCNGISKECTKNLDFIKPPNTHTSEIYIAFY